MPLMIRWVGQYKLINRYMIIKIETIEFSSWWDKCLSTVQEFSARHISHYLFGEELTVVEFYQDDNMFFTQAIAHLELNNIQNQPANFSILVIDEDQSKIEIPIHFIKKYYDKLTQNHYAISNDLNYVLHYQFDNDCIHLQFINKMTSQAIVWCNSIKLIPTWNKSFPFRQVLYHFFENSSYCLIHGAGVGVNGVGVLLTAKGGSGKSTAALACLSNGWQYVGDDFILLDTNTNYMYSLYNVAKLEPHQLVNFTNLAEMVLNENQDMQKQQIFLFPNYQDKLCHKMKLIAIITTQYNVNVSESTLLPCSAGHTLLAMAPSTIFLLKAGNALFNKLSIVCQSLSTYKLTTSSDIKSIPQIIKRLL